MIGPSGMVKKDLLEQKRSDLERKVHTQSESDVNVLVGEKVVRANEEGPRARQAEVRV